MKTCFVTGTDTGVGKTTVGVALLTAALRKGLRTGCMKPVESGCVRDQDGNLVAQDAEALRRVTNVGQESDDVCQYRFERDVAPVVAASSSGTCIDLSVIETAYQRLRDLDPDFALIEGAGGLLVPFSDTMLVVDLVSWLELPLLVVARPELGTINHTLLTLEVAASRGVEVAGFVFSCARPAGDPVFIASNMEEISKRTSAPYLGFVRYLSHPPVEEEVIKAGNPILDALLERL